MTHIRRDLSGANLSKLILVDATFKHCDLSGADFKHANLMRAEFHDCNLNGATFIGATLDGATFAECASDHDTFWSIGSHAWCDSVLTESQIKGLRGNYGEPWHAPWTCRECDSDENDCRCHDCETCGHHTDNCECCSRCHESSDNCQCCSECESTRDDCVLQRSVNRRATIARVAASVNRRATIARAKAKTANQATASYIIIPRIYSISSHGRKKTSATHWFSVSNECEPIDNDSSGQRDIIQHA